MTFARSGRDFLRQMLQDYRRQLTRFLNNQDVNEVRTNEGVPPVSDGSQQARAAALPGGRGIINAHDSEEDDN